MDLTEGVLRPGGQLRTDRLLLVEVAREVIPCHRCAGRGSGWTQGGHKGWSGAGSPPRSFASKVSFATNALIWYTLSIGLGLGLGLGLELGLGLGLGSDPNPNPNLVTQLLELELCGLLLGLGVGREGVCEH